MQPRSNLPGDPAERAAARKIIEDTIANTQGGLAAILSDFPHSGFVQDEDGEWCVTGRGEFRKLGLFGDQPIDVLREAAAKPEQRKRMVVDADGNMGVIYEDRKPAKVGRVRKPKPMPEDAVPTNDDEWFERATELLHDTTAEMRGER